MARETSRFAALKQLREPKPQHEEPATEVTAQPSEKPGVFVQSRNNESIPRTEELPEVTEHTAPRRRGRPKGKRSNPDFEQTTLFIRKDTKRAASHLLDDYGSGDLSSLVEKLLAAWVKRQAT